MCVHRRQGRGPFGPLSYSLYIRIQSLLTCHEILRSPYTPRGTHQRTGNSTRCESAPDPRCSEAIKQTSTGTRHDKAPQFFLSTTPRWGSTIARRIDINQGIDMILLDRCQACHDGGFSLEGPWFSVGEHGGSCLPNAASLELCVVGSS